ncbi:MAG: DnaD domain protein [Clostridia bacterium]|nr:DnaD domain protein [Clostridia bacterium]
MTYEINHTCYRQVFILPKELVEKHLKLSGALQLKVLLWVFYHQGVLEDLNQIADDLGASPSDVQDALQYWIVNEIIKEVGQTTATNQTTVDTSVAVSVPKDTSLKLKPQKPKHFEVARRMKESPEIAFLMVESQSKFGRNLTEHERSTLTFLVDAYGLSPAVLLMIIEYAVTIDRCNIKYIEKTAIDWSNNDIHTVEQAEEFLTKMEQSRIEWDTVCRTFGLDKRKPSKQEEIYVTRWFNDWRFGHDMLKEAYDQCVNNTGKVSFPYINKVLDQWHSVGYKKPDDIDLSVKPVKTKAKYSAKKLSEDMAPSYSIEDIENSL